MKKISPQAMAVSFFSFALSFSAFAASAFLPPETVSLVGEQSGDTTNLDQIIYSSCVDTATGVTCSSSYTASIGPVTGVVQIGVNIDVNSPPISSSLSSPVTLSLYSYTKCYLRRE